MKTDQVYQGVFFQPASFGSICGSSWQRSLISTVVGVIFRAFPSGECFVCLKNIVMQHLGHQLWKSLAWGALLGHIQSLWCLLVGPNFFLFCWEASQGSIRWDYLLGWKEAQTKAPRKRNGELFSGQVCIDKIFVFPWKSKTHWNQSSGSRESLLWWGFLSGYLSRTNILRANLTPWTR